MRHTLRIHRWRERTKFSLIVVALSPAEENWACCLDFGDEQVGRR